MPNYQGKYALVQFCPAPERQEFINIGLLLIVPDLNHFEVRFSKGQARVERLFGKQSKAFLDALKASFQSRLHEILKRDQRALMLEEFAARRANEIRLSALQPVAIVDPAIDFEGLFDELVGEQEPASREPQMRRKLRDAFVYNRVENLLDRPESVELPEYDLTLSVPYGYQNGCYNLIDGMRLPAQPTEGLREAGKRAMEGSLIWKHFEQGPRKRLVVVGDFSKQSNGFYQAVRDQFRESNVVLHRLDDMRALIDDIQTQAQLHGSSS